MWVMSQPAAPAADAAVLTQSVGGDRLASHTLLPLLT